MKHLPLALLLLLLVRFTPAGFASEVEILCTTDIHGRAEALIRLAPILRKNPVSRTLSPYPGEKSIFRGRRRKTLP